MNKQERIIAFLLGLALVGWMVHSHRMAAKQAREAAERPVATETAAPAAPAAPAQAALTAPVATQPQPALPSEPEEVATLRGDRMTVEVSSHGAVLKRVTLDGYYEKPGKPGPDNPPVTFDFAGAPALELSGVPGLADRAAYRVQRHEQECAVTLTAVTPQGLSVTRRMELSNGYKIRITDQINNTGDSGITLGTNSVQLGAIGRGTSKNELLSIDSLPASAGAKTRHWGSEKATKSLLAAGASGGMGCGRAPSAVGLADHISVPIHEPQAWIALKSRFFVTLFSASETNCGFVAGMARDTALPTYALKRLSARALFAGRTLAPGESLTRDYTLYVGPKKLSRLQAMGNRMDEIMEFGTFTWFCKLLVPTLNFFHRLIPNYGIAIILLTFLVRILFWPLTHKSTQSMRKMQEIQPKLKEIQAQFKDNPQKMQQETWAVYRENKVNPLSSCLPMLIQIPVFIALFTVLRSAVELRYASFLWITDLSEPENLFADVLPLPLNILPFLMSGTMALQSYLTPSMGDPQQQKMMMFMMPIMMLVMFYGFPSALSLYWTVSQVLSIIQMLMMRRKGHTPHDGDMTVEPPLTRQQRRQAARAH
ncbi:MAG TPA: membrane protein insertase YidC [Kiritimatiellia bacterium]|jgi:YidC/Oxa1 family membrane protein insertase|nr:membrane protein insertase YidC [Kiritimatiellia bacterium]HOM59041.1 membrane protein insertase YidC [Kiritimatiellia bacterium]HOR98827.1 membrane protein insertase YidC [Kiritimatiellia bacterium]HPK37786.1 membrane protein insertase YidC [Kiritimatiellia bacterium]HPW75752.1 membrane protein insertase YidC [Kiritimatiellia bacterium]